MRPADRGVRIDLDTQERICNLRLWFRLGLRPGIGGVRGAMIVFAGARKGSRQMGRPLALIACLSALLVGCKGSGQSTEPVDPFFGRVRIEPPRTGAAGSPSTVPYAPSLRPNPLRGSTATPLGSNLPAGGSLSGSPGWVPATASGNPNAAKEAPPAAASSGVPPTATRPPGPSAAEGSRGPNEAWALSQNPSTYRAGPENQGSIFQSFGAQGNSGDRIVIPPAAWQLAAGTASTAVPRPAADAGTLQGTATGSAASAGASAPVAAPASTAGPSSLPPLAASAPQRAGALQGASTGAAPNVASTGSTAAPWPAAAYGDRFAAQPGAGLSRASGTSRTGPSAGAPTMSRPTINLAEQRERIIRTLNPAGGAGGGDLPRPVDAAGVFSASGPLPPQAATGSSAPAVAGTGPSTAPAGPSLPSNGTRFPNRVVDITELPLAPTTR